MRRSNVVAVASVVVAALVVGVGWQTNAVYFISTWIAGSKESVGRHRFEVKDGAFFFPKTDKDNLFVGKMFAEGGVVQIVQTKLSAELWKNLQKKECEVYRCQSLVIEEKTLDGKELIAVRFTYKQRDGDLYYRLGHFFKDSALLIQFDGSAANRGRMLETIERLVAQGVRS